MSKEQEKVDLERQDLMSQVDLLKSCTYMPTPS